jgi:GT2 family glycosyltransferase
VITVVIPVYRYDHISPLCHDLLRESDICKILIIDNGGQWFVDEGRANSGIEVLTPEWNQGWLRACNWGMRLVLERDDEAALLLNDDVRLSPGFVAGLRAVKGPAVVGPMYDDVWPQQNCAYKGPAYNYVAKGVDREVSFIDGTAMFIPTEIIDNVGTLDEFNFSGFGWGADFDYCLRARDFGFPIIATERAYMNHLRGATAKKMFKNYEGAAGAELNKGMIAKYGDNWKEPLGI